MLGRSARGGPRFAQEIPIKRSTSVAQAGGTVHRTDAIPVAIVEAVR